VNVIFQGLQDRKEQSKLLNLESQSELKILKNKLCCATCKK